MRRPFARLAAISALAVATAVFTGSALAGGGHGSSGSAPGQEKQAQQSEQQQSAQQQSGDSQQAGVKPSSTTKHWTHTTVGSSPDVSKRYGNGKTAAEIAKGRGAPDSQPLTGPGNSQPHKTYDCRHKENKSGGVDVHAIKSYSSTGCQTTHGEQPKPEQQKPEVKQPEVKKPEEKPAEEHKVTICHATGSATNPYVQITVDEHALQHGHTAAKGDIVPAPAGGCPTAVAPETTPSAPMVSFCDMESATSGKLETKPATKVIEHELNGTPEEARDIVPPFTVNGQSYSQLWDANGQAIYNNQCQAQAVVQLQPVTTTTTESTPTTTTVAAPTTTTVAVTTETTTTTTAGGVAGTTTTSATGGVLGAETSLAKPKAAHHGVLGAVTHVAGGTLPFTGFPVWLAMLIAVALILAGVALRRRGAAGTRL